MDVRVPFFMPVHLEGLRDMTSQRFGLYGLFLGDDQGEIAGSESGSSVVSADEGLTQCLAAVVGTRESKTNCKGLTQYAAMMWSKKGIHVSYIEYVGLSLRPVSEFLSTWNSALTR